MPRTRPARRESTVRVEGKVVGDNYVVSHDGILRTYTLDEARQDRKLLKAIERNGWEPVDGRQ